MDMTMIFRKKYYNRFFLCLEQVQKSNIYITIELYKGFWENARHYCTSFSGTVINGLYHKHVMIINDDSSVISK